MEQSSSAEELQKPASPKLSEVNTDQSRSSVIGGVISEMRSLLGLKSANGSLKESLEELIEEHDSSDKQQIDAEERTLLRNIIGLSEVRVEDVATPRADIVAVEEHIPFEDLKQIILKEEHSRIPVFRNTIDEITGFIHIKDLTMFMFQDNPFDLKGILHPMMFISPSMRVIDLLIKMRDEQAHMATIVDEYGGVFGLVTMEDLIEEIVGEIRDEHDIAEAQEERLIKLSDALYEASARLELEELETAFNIDLQLEKDDDIDTLGGLISRVLGRVPAVGEVVAHPSGLEFEITQSDPRRIHRVLIRRTVQPASSV